MLNYYSDTLSAVSEEMDKYTAKMEHQTSVLEHYSNMMDILGKSKDYESMGSILQGQAETLKNELAVAEAEYNLYAQQVEEKRALYEQALAEEDYAAAEIYKKEWEAADEAAMEAQSNMLDKTEQWAEAMKAVVENKLAGLAQTLEQSLTGGSSFEQINTQLERAASLQEEYLTTTNQIYETNKLIRTVQQEIDKSTNLVAKQRLKDLWKDKRSYWKRLVCAGAAMFAACFTFLFFGPLEMVAFASDSLDYGFKDVLPLLATISFVVFLIGSLLIPLFKGKIYNYIVTAIFGTTICGYLQAALMNKDFGLLNGEAIDWPQIGRASCRERVSLCV